MEYDYSNTSNQAGPSNHGSIDLYLDNGVTLFDGDSSDLMAPWSHVSCAMIIVCTCYTLYITGIITCYEYHN